MTNLDLTLQDLDVYNDFIRRHIGPGSVDEPAMLAELGMKSLDELIDKVVPKSIRRDKQRYVSIKDSPIFTKIQAVRQLNPSFSLLFCF